MITGRVKTKFDATDNVYIIKSKSLPAALNRLTLLVEVLGQDRVEFNHYAPTEGKNKHWIYVYVV